MSTVDTPIREQAAKTPDAPKTPPPEKPQPAPIGIKEIEIVDSIAEAKKSGDGNPDVFLSKIAENNASPVDTSSPSHEITDQIETQQEKTTEAPKESSEQLPKTPQEILQQLPPSIRKPMQSVFDTLDVLEQPAEYTGDAETLLSPSTIATKLRELTQELRRINGNASLMPPVVKEIVQLQKQAEQWQDKITQEQQEDAEQQTQLKTHVDTDQGKQIDLESEKSQLELKLKTEENRPGIIKRFRLGKIEELKKQITDREEKITVRNQKNSLRQRADERETVQKDLANVPTKEETRRIVVENTKNILQDALRDYNSDCEQLASTPEFKARIVDTVLNGQKPIIEALIKEGEITEDDAKEFSELNKQSILSDTYTSSQTFEAFDTRTRFVLHELGQKLRNTSVQGNIDFLNYSSRNDIRKSLHVALATSHFSDEEKENIGKKVDTVLALTEDEAKKMEYHTRELFDNVMKMDSWIAMLHQPETLSVFSKNNIAIANESLINRANQYNSPGGFELSGAAPVSLLLDQDNLQSALLLSLLQDSYTNNPDSFRRIADFSSSEKGGKSIEALSIKSPELALELKNFTTQDGRTVEDIQNLRTSQELAKIIATNPGESELDRTMAIYLLRKQGNSQVLNEIFTNSQDQTIRDLAGTSLVALGRLEENSNNLLNVFEKLNIDPEIQEHFLKQYLGMLPTDPEDVSGNHDYFRLEHHYPFIRILAENPELMKQFLAQDPENPTINHTLKLVAIKPQYAELGKSLARLITQETPQIQDVFKFVTAIESWPEKWQHPFTLSQEQGIDSHLQWSNLTVDRRKKLLKDDLDEYQKDELAKQDKISSEFISKEYGLLLVKNILKHVIEDSQDPQKKESADLRNREIVATHQQPLQPGTLLHGTSVEALHMVLKAGEKAGEFLGTNYTKDATPFGADFGQVREQDNSILPETSNQVINNQIQQLNNANEFTRIYFQNIAAGYGAKPDIDRGTAVDIKTGEDKGITFIFGRANENAFLRDTEYQGPMREQHKLILVGFPATELSGLIVNASTTHTLERAKNEIIENGFYIPIYNVDGTLLFTPEEYDLAKEKVQTAPEAIAA